MSVAVTPLTFSPSSYRAYSQFQGAIQCANANTSDHDIFSGLSCPRASCILSTPKHTTRPFKNITHFYYSMPLQHKPEVSSLTNLPKPTHAQPPQLLHLPHHRRLRPLPPLKPKHSLHPPSILLPTTLPPRKHNNPLRPATNSMDSRTHGKIQPHPPTRHRDPRPRHR